MIRVHGIRAQGYHGVFPEEKTHSQSFIVDVDIDSDIAIAAQTDTITQTLNYQEVVDSVVRVVNESSYNLIESLAWAIAEELSKLLCGGLPAMQVPGTSGWEGGVPTVSVRVHKPQAPILGEVDDISVHVTRPVRADTLFRVVLSLGSNIGDGKEALTGAFDALALHPDITLTAQSSFYSTPAVGPIAQADFTNAVALITTTLPVEHLLGVCQGIELAAGRTREVRWGPRRLDIDLIAAEATCESCPGTVDARTGAVDVLTEASGTRSGTADAPVGAAAWHPVYRHTPRLRLPHPEAMSRAFVLVPWAEIQPEAVVTFPHKFTGIPVVEAARAAPDYAGVRRMV